MSKRYAFFSHKHTFCGLAVYYSKKLFGKLEKSYGWDIFWKEKY